MNKFLFFFFCFFWGEGVCPSLENNANKNFSRWLRGKTVIFDSLVMDSLIPDFIIPEN